MKYLLILFAFSLSVAHAQQLIIVDSISKAPIPLVHVFDGKKGVVTDSSGTFFWKQKQADSLSLSCLGYAKKKIAALQIRDTLYLLPKAVELMPVMVSNRTLTATEIIDSVKANTSKTVDFGLSSSEVFVHHIDLIDIQKSFEFNYVVIHQVHRMNKIDPCPIYTRISHVRLV